IASALVLGRLTGTPTVSSGAVIMKMTSSTSMTSTIGVTLISAIGCDLRRWMPRCGRAPSLTAMSVLLLKLAREDGAEFARERLQPVAVTRDVVVELVEGEHSRDGRDQPEGGREQ